MKSILGIIYKATSPSGKVYIGQTSNSLKRRKIQHKCVANFTDSKFSRAIKKYGIDSLTWEILHKDIPTDQLDNLEILEIASYNSFINGYNSTPGGDGVKEHTKEAKEKMSKAQKGKVMSQIVKDKISKTLKQREFSLEHKEKLSIATKKAWESGLKQAAPCKKETKEKLAKINKGRFYPNEWKEKLSRVRKEKGVAKGEKNPNFGKKASQETKLKMSLAGKGKHSGEKSPLSKINMKIAKEIRETYQTQNKTHQEIGEIYNISDTTVWRVLNNLSWRIN